MRGFCAVMPLLCQKRHPQRTLRQLPKLAHANGVHSHTFAGGAGSTTASQRPYYGKSACEGGFSGVPGGGARFARLSRRQLYLMEEPPIKAVRLAFPAALLTSRACPAGSYYGKSAFSGGFSGVPGGSRTHGLSLRRRTLYPAELRKRFRCCFILGVRARFVKRNAQSGGGTLGTKSAPLCG